MLPQEILEIRHPALAKFDFPAMRNASKFMNFLRIVTWKNRDFYLKGQQNSFFTKRTLSTKNAGVWTPRTLLPSSCGHELSKFQKIICGSLES